MKAALLAAALLAAPAVAQDPPAVQIGGWACGPKGFAFHFVATRPSEGNIYLDLRLIAQVCRAAGLGGDDAPTNQPHDHHGDDV